MLFSDFDHLNYDDEQAKNIIAQAEVSKINHIHKIIKSTVQKCTNIICDHSFQNKENESPRPFLKIYNKKLIINCEGPYSCSPYITDSYRQSD